MRARNSNVVSALMFLAPTSPCRPASSLTRAPNTIGATASEIRKPRSAAMRVVYLRHRMASWASRLRGAGGGSDGPRAASGSWPVSPLATYCW
jgi:hypothetical protein